MNMWAILRILGVAAAFLFGASPARGNGYIPKTAFPAMSEIPVQLVASGSGSDFVCLWVPVALGGLFAFLWILAKLTENAAVIRKTKLSELQSWEANLQREKDRVEQDKKAVGILAQQKSSGFPWLAEAYSEYSLLQQLKEAEVLETKKHPAVKSAERIREIARDRRVVEQKLRVVQGIVAYWIEFFPFLEDWLGDDVDEELLRRLLSKNIEAPFKDVPDVGEDPVRIILNRLSDDEYRKLSAAERNQRALDAWRARSKSRWQIGREYERYIGYLCESHGYNVYYQGILEGYDDLGRDLIARKSDGTLIIQCKCWSRHKQIHEKHVNQLFGTSVKYMLDHPGDRVVPVLYTSTELTDRARQFAAHLRVQVKEGFPLKDYPCVKCNVSRATGERIYHLPFDQQYDTTQIEPSRGECYVETVAEAEALGFRRAWRWHGEDADAE